MAKEPEKKHPWPPHRAPGQKEPEAQNPAGFSIINIVWTDDVNSEEGKNRAIDAFSEAVAPITTLAERLGVTPYTDLKGKDGIFFSVDKKTAYDIFEIIDKFLVKVDIIARMSALIDEAIEKEKQ